MNALQKKEYQTYYKDAVFEILNGYRPHDKQALIHYSDARFRVAICGRRFGKSKLAAKEAESILCNPALPNKRIWIVAPTYDLTDKVFREVYQDVATGYKQNDYTVVSPILPPEAITKKSENDRIIRTAWGTEVIGKTADKPEGLVGEGLDLLILDEAAKIKQRTWEQHLRPTLSDRQGKALFITTPEGTNWIYSLYLRGKDNNHPSWESFSFKSIDSPFLRYEDIEEARQTLTEETFKQEYEAQFVSFAGQVYKDFDVSVHVIRDLPDRFDEIIGGIDYGFNNPSVILMIGVRDRRYYVIEEVYRTEMLLNDIKTELKRLKSKYNFNRLYADHKPDFNKPLQSCGYAVIPARKDVTAGIEKVSGMIKIKQDGKPSFYIHSSCTNTIREHEGYRYPEKKDLQNSKEEPIKDNDHTCDAVRYAIYTREHGTGVVRTTKARRLYG